MRTTDFKETTNRTTGATVGPCIVTTTLLTDHGTGMEIHTTTRTNMGMARITVPTVLGSTSDSEIGCDRTLMFD